MNGEDVQAIVQIFAEAAIGDHLNEIAVRGGDDADINLDRAFGTDRVYLSFLNGAKQFDLHIERKLADFVQKKGAAIGFDKFAGMFFRGTGKSTFLMAEKNAFDQVFRDRAAIDGDKRVPCAVAFALNGACDQFFPDTAFAFDQDGNVGLGGAATQFKDRGHGRGPGNDIVKGQSAFRLFLQAVDLAGEGGHFQGVAD